MTPVEYWEVRFVETALRIARSAIGWRAYLSILNYELDRLFNQ